MSRECANASWAATTKMTRDKTSFPDAKTGEFPASFRAWMKIGAAVKSGGEQKIWKRKGERARMCRVKKKKKNKIKGKTPLRENFHKGARSRRARLFNDDLELSRYHFRPEIHIFDLFLLKRGISPILSKSSSKNPRDFWSRSSFKISSIFPSKFLILPAEDSTSNYFEIHIFFSFSK